MRRAQEMSLADIAESVSYGYTASATQEPVGPHLLRITDIVPPQIEWRSVPFCKIEEKDRERFSLEPGDIVIARTGATVGYAKLIRNHHDAVFASYLVRIRVDQAKADPGYVGRIVESGVYKRFVLSQVGGAAQPNANARVLSSFKLPIPAIQVQRHIAGILATYDDLIENNRRRIQLLEQAARLLYKEWFVNRRFPGHEHVKIKDGVPEGWEKKIIDEVCQTVGGGTPSTQKPEYWNEGDVTWVIPTDVTRNDCIALISTEKKITELGLKASSARLVPPDTILMTSRASVGFFAMIDQEVCTNQGFINISPNEDWMRMYLLHNLMSRVEEIRSHAGGATYKEISKGRFRRMRVIIPPKAVAQEFNDFAYQVLQQVRVLKKQQIGLAKARDILLPRLMNGEVSV